MTGGVSEGRVFVVNIESGKILKSIAVGHTPMAPVRSPDGNTLYVCNRFNNDISILDLKTGAELVRVPVAREPVAADILQDGRYLFVANLIPNGRADVDYVDSEISVVDTQTRTAKSVCCASGRGRTSDRRLSKIAATGT